MDECAPKLPTQPQYGVKHKGSDELITVSESCSQIEGSPFDGPIIFNSLEETLSAFEMTAEEFDKEYDFCAVTIVWTHRIA